MQLVILDRDGVINEESDDYVKNVDEWRPLPGSLEAIARLTQAGCRVFVASNQSGIGRSLFDFDSLFAILDRMQKACAEVGGRIDGVEFAPEHPDEATERRKPAPGMLKDLARRLGVTLDEVPFVGDSLSDVLAARAAGAKPVLVKTGRGALTAQDPRAAGVEVHEDLAAFVAAWLEGR